MMTKMCFIETFWTYYNTSYVCYDDKQIFIILHGYIAPQIRYKKERKIPEYSAARKTRDSNAALIYGF